MLMFMDKPKHKDIVNYWFGLRFSGHQKMIDDADAEALTINPENNQYDGEGHSLGHLYRDEWYDRFNKDGLDAICHMDPDSRDLFFYVLKRYYYDKAHVGDSVFGKDYPKVTQEEVLNEIRSDQK